MFIGLGASVILLIMNIAKYPEIKAALVQPLILPINGLPGISAGRCKKNYRKEVQKATAGGKKGGKFVAFKDNIAWIG